MAFQLIGHPKGMLLNQWTGQRRAKNPMYIALTMQSVLPVASKESITGDGVQGVGVLDLPQPRAAGVAHALRLQLCGQVSLHWDEAVAVGVLRAVWHCLHIHLEAYPADEPLRVQIQFLATQ